MQDKYGFVYIWYDRKRKMYYIGSHWGTEDDGYICSSTRMRNAYRRRPEDFKRRIISIVLSSRTNLLSKEQEWLDLVKKKPSYYNLRYDVPKITWRDDPNRAKTIGERISAAKKGKPGTWLGKKIPRESVEKSRNARKGKKRSDETKMKMSASAKARIREPMTEETKQKISTANTGRKFGPHTEERKKQLSEANIGKHNIVMSEESKAKMSAAKKGKPWSQARRDAFDKKKDLKN